MPAVDLDIVRTCKSAIQTIAWISLIVVELLYTPHSHVDNVQDAVGAA